MLIRKIRKVISYLVYMLLSERNLLTCYFWPEGTLNESSSQSYHNVGKTLRKSARLWIRQIVYCKFMITSSQRQLSPKQIQHTCNITRTLDVKYQSSININQWTYWTLPVNSYLLPVTFLCTYCSGMSWKITSQKDKLKRKNSQI